MNNSNVTISNNRVIKYGSRLTINIPIETGFLAKLRYLFADKIKVTAKVYFAEESTEVLGHECEIQING